MPLRPGGVGIYTDPDGRQTETHCSTCAHCQRISEFPSLRVMHEHVDICRSCMRLVCRDCAGRPCRPWELEMEKQEARYRFLKSAGLL
jgi:hypothetical protein